MQAVEPTPAPPPSPADVLACQAWNARMLAFQGPAQPSPALGDALNAGYRYLEVKPRLRHPSDGCIGYRAPAEVDTDPRARALYEVQGLLTPGRSPFQAQPLGGIADEQDFSH